MFRSGTVTKDGHVRGQNRPFAQSGRILFAVAVGHRIAEKRRVKRTAEAKRFLLSGRAAETLHSVQRRWRSSVLRAADPPPTARKPRPGLSDWKRRPRGWSSSGSDDQELHPGRSSFGWTEANLS